MVLVNKTSNYHIILVFFACLCFTAGFSYSNITKSNFKYLEVKNDSLQIDDSNIPIRSFDDFSERYIGEDFVYERTQENSGWWTRFKQWLSGLIRDLFDIKSQGQASDITNWSIKIAGIIIFLLVIYFIFKAVVNDEGKWVFGKSSDKKIIPVTDIENNIHSTDFDKLVNDAEAENNFRLAIRYYYLWLLKYLTDSEVIEYDVEKTNSDYFNEIKTEETKKDFAYTSYLYNYIWYGEFNVNQLQYAKAKDAFVKFLNSNKA